MDLSPDEQVDHMRSVVGSLPPGEFLYGHSVFQTQLLTQLTAPQESSATGSVRSALEHTLEELQSSLATTLGGTALAKVRGAIYDAPHASVMSGFRRTLSLASYCSGIPFPIPGVTYALCCARVSTARSPTSLRFRMPR
jgi:hypothetical protein